MLKKISNVVMGSIYAFEVGYTTRALRNQGAYGQGSMTRTCDIRTPNATLYQLSYALSFPTSFLREEDMREKEYGRCMLAFIERISK